MARFSIDGKVYSMSAIDAVSLKDLILFNTQAADMGLAERWNDIERISTEINAMSTDEAEAHPSKLLMFAVTVWVSRRLAGEDLSFGEAIDIPLSSVTVLADPSDRQAKANPTKERKPKVSAPAGDPPEPVE